jgi:hypothetical protein
MVFCGAPLSASSPVAVAGSPEAVILDGSGLHASILEAAAAGKSGIVIPPGVYRMPSVVPPKGEEPWHLVFANLKNLEIDATGVTVIFSDRRQAGINFRGCENVTLKGLRIRRETPTCSQGRVVAIDPLRKYVDVRIDKGYPTDLGDKTLYPHFWSNIFTPDGKTWKGQLRAPTPYVWEQLEPDLVRVFTYELSGEIYAPVEVGDRLAWRGSVLSDIRSTRCTGMRFIGVSVEGGAGMAFHETGGGGGHLYKDCIVTYGPTPPGAEFAPLLATTADGFHSSDTRRGPVLEGCRFEGTDDDAIAIHGNYSLIIESQGASLKMRGFQEASNVLSANPGDTLRFYDTAGVFAGEAVVRSITRLTDYQPPAPPDPRYRVFQDPSRARYLDVVLDREIAAQPGWLAGNMDTIGRGFVVRNCTILHTHARGILPKSAEGLIEGNLIEGTARAAIEMLPEMTWWSEADYCHDLVIRNNTIRGVSLNRRTGDLRHPGALTLFAWRNGAGAYVPSPGGHRNILIEGNRFERNDGVNILVTSAKGVEIKNNTFVSPMNTPSDFGRDKGVNPGALIWLHESADITLSGNRIESPGPGMQKPVEATPTARDVSGLDNGIRIIEPLSQDVKKGS